MLATWYLSITLVPKLWYTKAFKVVHETLLFFYTNRKHCFYLQGSINKFLHFSVLYLLVSKNGHYNFSQPFCSCRIRVKSGLPNF